MKPLIVVGIDTNVGKTVTALIITEALKGYYWKPIQCGTCRDKEWVNEMLSLKERCYPEAFCLKAPCSPHLAARKEGLRIEAKDLCLPDCPGPLIIEGTGGLLPPLNEKESWVDGMGEGHWILVHRHYLGSLNHFFLTVEAMRQRGLSLLGVVFNGKGDRKTEEILLTKTNTLCLGRLTWQKELTKRWIQKTAKKWRAPLNQLLKEI